MREITVDTYRDDPLYPRVTRAVEEILRHGKVVTPVDVLVRMQLLAPGARRVRGHARGG